MRDVLRVPNAALRFRPETAEGKDKSAATGTTGAAGSTGRRRDRPGSRTARTVGGPGDRAAGGGRRRAAFVRARRRGHGRARTGARRCRASARRQRWRRAPGRTAAADADGLRGRREERARARSGMRTGITDGHYTQVVQVMSGDAEPRRPGGHRRSPRSRSSRARHRPAAGAPGGGGRGRGGLGRFWSGDAMDAPRSGHRDPRPDQGLPHGRGRGARPARAST